LSTTTVAVLGGGHGALAAAADLARRGFEVHLALRNRQRFAELFSTRRLNMTGAAGDATVELASAGDDHAAAVRRSEMVLMPVPAFAQEGLAQAVAGAVRPGQLVLLAPGNLGSLPVSSILPSALLAETATLPYGARQSGPASVAMALRAHHLPTGVLPSNRTAEAMQAVKRMYPEAEPVEDVLSAALLNSNGALHAPLVLLNAGPLEHPQPYDIHVEGTTAGVLRVIDALDSERLTLREALGYGRPHWPLMDYYENRDWFYGPRAYERVQSRSVWRERIGFDHRYLTEDVTFGLVLWSSLGRRLGVATPLSDACIALASALAGRDLRVGGRSLESVGLDGPDAGALRSRL
jgi:opine dehydrogenase